MVEDEIARLGRREERVPGQILTQLHDEAILLQHHLVYMIWQVLQEGQVSHLDMPQVIAPSV